MHDGNTLSTSGSILTNSEIDKAEYIDKDIDFFDWEEGVDGDQQWITMGPNGKMLRG